MDMIDFKPIIFKDEKKEKVQREAYDIWASKDYIGTLEMATGVGKTMIGIMAIQQEVSREKQIIIVVPKIDLMNQWVEEMLENLGDKVLQSERVDHVNEVIPTIIGKVGDGFRDFQAPIKVCVINSIRDIEDLEADLLILDEIHRYGSRENFKFLKNGNFKKILGLTATIERQDGAHVEILKYVPLLHRYSQGESINDGILSRYKLTNVRVNLEQDEQIIYDEVQEFIRENFKLFGYNFNVVKQSLGRGINGGIAVELMRAFSKRRTIILHATNKKRKVAEIIEKFEKDKKTIIFCEYIKTATAIRKHLKELGMVSAVYHSGIKSDKKKEMLADFKSGKYKIMVAVKSLDEGTNIPDCEVAIIVAGTAVKRQMVQRLGRILRTYEGKDIARVYQIYVPETKEEDWIQMRSNELVRNAESVNWL